MGYSQCECIYALSLLYLRTFHLNDLKHNTRMAFPAVLIFHDVPESIDYEMTSKHSPDVIKGKIEIAY